MVYNPSARQLVNHRVTVNGRVVDIVSYQCRPETIAVRDREASRKMKQTCNTPV